MKRLISLLLCLALVAAIGPQAFATEYKYSSTEKFVELLEENDYTYTVVGCFGDEYELVKVKSETLFYDEIELLWSFRGEEAIILVSNIINYDENSGEGLMEMLNDMNYKFSYLKFFSNRGFVMAEMDLFLREDEYFQDICLEAMQLMLDNVDAAYLLLLPFEAENSQVTEEAGAGRPAA